MPRQKSDGPVRYAVVGLGYIAQVAVLPAFANAKKHATLAALISDDDRKLKELAGRYDVEFTARYDDYERCLQEASIDAVYIALPNHLHREYTIRAAELGVHVLCEKPMAVTTEECLAMLKACEDNNVKLMIAYRLHFEKANLRAVEILANNEIGSPRIFDAVFSMDVKDRDNIRLDASKGGGTVYDIGIYCINAARYLFRAEPVEVSAFTARGRDPRFAEIDEMTTAILRFPNERLASFTCSFGAAGVSCYRIVGTEGDLVVEPAFDYADSLKHRLTRDGKTSTRTFRKRDQFAPELIHFAQCIRNDSRPEPDGLEGLADVQIIEAIYESAASGRAIALDAFPSQSRPDMEIEITRPAVRKPQLVNANPPGEE